MQHTIYVVIESGYNNDSGTTIENSWELTIDSPCLNFMRSLNEPELAKLILSNPIILDDQNLQEKIVGVDPDCRMYVRAREVTQAEYQKFFD
jgi:hypothetical protein